MSAATDLDDFALIVDDIDSDALEVAEVVVAEAVTEAAAAQLTAHPDQQAAVAVALPICS